MLSNRMIVFEDMIETKTGNVLVDIGINNKYNAYKNRPKQCPECESKSVRGVEILGAYDGPILWGCLECSLLLRRFGIKKTERMLDSVKDTYTNSEDWGWRSRSEFS